MYALYKEVWAIKNSKNKSDLNKYIKFEKVKKENQNLDLNKEKFIITYLLNLITHNKT